MYQSSGTHFIGKMYDSAQNAANVWHKNEQGVYAQQAANANKMRQMAPGTSVYMALNANPNIQEAEAYALYQAAAPQAKTYAQRNGVSLDEGFDAVITTTRFQDPALEQTRKVAAKDWMQMRPNIYKGMLGFAKHAVDYGTAPGTPFTPAGDQLMIDMSRDPAGATNKLQKSIGVDMGVR